MVLDYDIPGTGRLQFKVRPPSAQRCYTYGVASTPWKVGHMAWEDRFLLHSEHSVNIG